MPAGPINRSVWLGWKQSEEEPGQKKENEICKMSEAATQ